MKTGTAEQADGQGGLKSSWVLSTVGLVPANDPQYVVSVVIAEPGGNPNYACPPVFRDIMGQVIKRYRVDPSPDGSPVMPIAF